jgi:hypothetical protein
MIAQDILLDASGELLIRNGDFVVGPSDKQSINSILTAFPGWWKQFPTVGVGMSNYINAKGKNAEIQRNIKLQLESDGFVLDTIILETSEEGLFNITTNAHRV